MLLFVTIFGQKYAPKKLCLYNPTSAVAPVYQYSSSCTVITCISKTSKKFIPIKLIP